MELLRAVYLVAGVGVGTAAVCAYAEPGRGSPRKKRFQFWRLCSLVGGVIEDTCFSSLYLQLPTCIPLLRLEALDSTLEEPQLLHNLIPYLFFIN